MVNTLLTWAGQIIMRRLLVSLGDYPECFSVLQNLGCYSEPGIRARSYKVDRYSERQLTRQRASLRRSAPPPCPSQTRCVGSLVAQVSVALVGTAIRWPIAGAG